MTPEQREELKAAAEKLVAARSAPKHIFNARLEEYREHAPAFAILSLIAQVEALTVPQGWKCVPVEVTEAMRAVYENNSVAPMGAISRYGYRAMIESAPTIPAIPGTKEDAK
jgi:hypothetical protein